MRHLLTIPAAAMLALAVPAAAQGPGLNVYLPPAAGFVIGHQQRQGRAIIVEMVPKGETVQRFNKMITLQTAPGLGRIPAADYVAEFAKRYRTGCPRATALAVSMGSGAGVRIDCPRHPNTGQTETVFARAFNAGPDMAMTQITLKYFVMPKEAQWARDYLGRVRVS